MVDANDILPGNINELFDCSNDDFLHYSTLETGTDSVGNIIANNASLVPNTMPMLHEQNPTLVVPEQPGNLIMVLYNYHDIFPST